MLGLYEVQLNDRHKKSYSNVKKVRFPVEDTNNIYKSVYDKETIDTLEDIIDTWELMKAKERGELSYVFMTEKERREFLLWGLLALMGVLCLISWVIMLW